MKIVDELEVRGALPWAALVERIQKVFVEGAEVPLRTSHTVRIPGDQDATLLLMPAWQGGRYIVIKAVNIVPGNVGRSLPSVAASVLVFDGKTGALLAILDGGELTARRTAAASALAARFLARPDAKSLLIVGTGRIAANLVSAHCASHPFEKVSIWGRTPAHAKALAERSREAAPVVVAVEDLEGGVWGADVISCATLTHPPLVRGAWLKAGTHLDLVGSYTPQMREADDEAVRRAAVIVVDTYDGTLTEAGDLVQPINSGVISRANITGQLAEICSGTRQGRTADEQISMFKSVGTALEDYAAAALVVERLGARG